MTSTAPACARSEIRAAALSVKEVETVRRLLTMHLGPEEILVNMDIGIEGGLSGEEQEAIVARVEEEIMSLVPAATRLFIEVRPEAS